MNRATPQMRIFAKRLMAYEVNENKSSKTKLQGVFQECEKLGPHLATLMGNAGFQALISRALALVGTEVPWLRKVRVKVDGSLEGVEELHAQLDPDEFSKGRAVLLAQLLDLLVAFIGENLTLRLVREVWPKVRPNDLNLDGGEKNEKTK